MSREVKTIARAEPSIDPKPMKLHFIEVTPTGQLGEKTYCGRLWDRFNGPRTSVSCEECQNEWYRRNEIGRD